MSTQAPDKPQSRPTPSEEGRSITIDMGNPDCDALMLIASKNPMYRVEREADGKVTFMAPMYASGSRREGLLTAALVHWGLETDLGPVHGSNGSYEFPDTSVRMPDASFYRWEKLDELGRDFDGIHPFAPDFAAEIRSSSDNLADLKNKMLAYLDNGVRLAWLIDPYQRIVWIYRPDKEIETLNQPSIIEGDDDLLPGFVFEIAKLFGWESNPTQS